MYWDYIESYAVDDRLSRASFTRLVKLLTYFDQKALNAVDYALGILLYNNLVLLKDIACTITENLPKETAMKMIEKLDYFMKYDFIAHRSGCDVTSHHIILLMLWVLEDALHCV